MSDNYSTRNPANSIYFCRNTYSSCRDRRAGEFLKELHLTEGCNTGFQKIIRALKANGSPMPVFETDNEQLVWSDIGMGETITLVKMAKLLGISKATAARVTKSLRDKKIIDRQGSAKKGQWIILK